MEGYQKHNECVLVEDKPCTSCRYCTEIEALDEISEDYEPSDAEIEQYIEEQMLAEEIASDNL